MDCQERNASARCVLSIIFILVNATVIKKAQIEIEEFFSIAVYGFPVKNINSMEILVFSNDLRKQS